jgi:NAD(P)-dependent dehydrogenase (short-subunit alcohol dehydrogenase family)
MSSASSVRGRRRQGRTDSLAGRVAVVTGASSGIGRATALELSRRGATVVVAARRLEALEELVRQIEAGGGRAHAVQTDVADAAQVEGLARTAVERFDRLDIWVNNAAVGIYGRFEDISPEAFRRVIDVDLFGYVHGARAALAAFRRTGSGVLINNASVLGTLASSYQAPYSMAKHAIVAFGEALRQELRDTPAIRVSTIMPGGVDTPFFEHAANYIGRTPKPPNPVYSAEHVATVIADCAEDPRREVVVGRAVNGLIALRHIAPSVFEPLHARQVDLDYFEDRPAPPSDGSLFEPRPSGTGTDGRWPHTGEEPLRVAALGAIGIAATLGGLLFLRSRR